MYQKAKEISFFLTQYILQYSSQYHNNALTFLNPLRSLVALS